MADGRRVRDAISKQGEQARPNAIPQDTNGDLERARLLLEQERLRFERQKIAIESRLKRQELSVRQGKSWKELLANPLTLAIVGGFLTLMTTIVSNHYTQKAASAAEELRARLQRESSQQQLQADLIKKFVEGQTETVRENLRFLVDAGLLPDYANNIESYLVANPETAPQVGSTGFVGGIVGPDERLRLDKLDSTLQARFHGEGIILIGGKDGSVVCTGFLVAPDVLVTANYCLRSPEGAQASEAKFLLLPASPSSKDAVSAALQLTRLVEVKIESGKPIPGAVLVALQSPIASNSSYLHLSSEAPTLGGSSMAFWAADRDSWLYSTGPDCRAMQIEEREFRHLCDTGGGSSGAPLIDSNGTVIGVHVGSGPNGKRALRADVIRNDPSVLKVFGRLPGF